MPKTLRKTTIYSWLRERLDPFHVSLYFKESFRQILYMLSPEERLQALKLNDNNDCSVLIGQYTVLKALKSYGCYY